MNSFNRFYAQAQKDKSRKRRQPGIKKRSKTHSPPIRMGMQDRGAQSMKQNYMSDPKSADSPSSSTFMPKG